MMLKTFPVSGMWPFRISPELPTTPTEVFRGFSQSLAVKYRNNALDEDFYYIRRVAISNLVRATDYPE
jgi:hypothetical protein